MEVSALLDGLRTVARGHRKELRSDTNVLVDKNLFNADYYVEQKDLCVQNPLRALMVTSHQRQTKRTHPKQLLLLSAPLLAMIHLRKESTEIFVRPRMTKTFCQPTLSTP